MGGTFDPIHHGHLVAASEVAARFGLDEVVFVPTGQPWQKSHEQVAPAEDRYLMTVIATASNPRFSVSRVDIDRRRSDLHRRHPAGPARHVRARRRAVLHHRRRRTGPDLHLARSGGAARPSPISSASPAPVMPWPTPGCLTGRVTLVEVPALAISSTAVRRRVNSGEPVWYLVPDGVVQYIAKRHLYAGRRSDDAADQVPGQVPARSSARSSARSPAVRSKECSESAARPSVGRKTRGAHGGPAGSEPELPPEHRHPRASAGRPTLDAPPAGTSGDAAQPRSSRLRGAGCADGAHRIGRGPE